MVTSNRSWWIHMVLSTDQYDHLRHKTWSTLSEVFGGSSLQEKKHLVSPSKKSGRFHLFHLNRLVGKKDTRSHLQIWPGFCCCSQDLQSRTQQNSDFLASWSMLITISGPSLYWGSVSRPVSYVLAVTATKHTQTKLQTLHHTSRYITPFYTLNQDTEKTRRARCHSCDFSNALIIALKHCKSGWMNALCINSQKLMACCHCQPLPLALIAAVKVIISGWISFLKCWWNDVSKNRGKRRLPGSNHD